MTVAFFVPGTPVPAGSKKAFLHRHTGKLIVTDDSGKRGREWRKLVAQAARLAHHGEPFVGPVSLALTFLLPRPKVHYQRDGTLRRDMPVFHTSRPDATKLLRSVEDALTGIVWADDAQVARQIVSKAYAATPREIGVLVSATAGVALPPRLE